MSNKIKRDYQRIIDELTLIDASLLKSIISNIYPEVNSSEFGMPLTPKNINLLAYIIVNRVRGHNYINHLKKIIKRNNYLLDREYSVDKSFDEIEDIIHKNPKLIGLKLSDHYSQILLRFFSHNIFQGNTVNRLKGVCKELFLQYLITNPKEEEDKKIMLSENLRGSNIDVFFNSLFYEYPGFEKYFEQTNPEDIELGYFCKYDKEKKTFYDVKRGIMYFLFRYFDNFFAAKSFVATLIEKQTEVLKEIFEEKEKTAKIRENYFADKDKLLLIKKANKNLKKENKRLNTQVLKKIDKSNNIELERSVHNLQKENNYNLSRIEKMEEQIAVFEEEKKLNKELQENVEIKEEDKKEVAELPEYQNIVIMGGRWTSNHRKEVTEYLANNEVEFIDADKTLRHWDRIKNADMIFYDTSYNAHSYYYKAKKLAGEFYHLSSSNVNEMKKIFEIDI